jgi:hypothetical protein
VFQNFLQFSRGAKLLYLLATAYEPAIYVHPGQLLWSRSQKLAGVYPLGKCFAASQAADINKQPSLRVLYFALGIPLVF